jgi:hypothetical protein
VIVLGNQVMNHCLFLIQLIRKMKILHLNIMNIMNIIIICSVRLTVIHILWKTAKLIMLIRWIRLRMLISILSRLGMRIQVLKKWFECIGLQWSFIHVSFLMFFFNIHSFFFGIFYTLMLRRRFL